jgi:hypothetical protein
VFEPCRSVAPPAFATPDGTMVTCHLHTDGPVLGGVTVLGRATRGDGTVAAG